MKILVAVDGSRRAVAAVESVIEHAGWYREKPEIELVTVESDAGRSAARLALAKKRLDVAKLPYRVEVLAGETAAAIVKHARKTRCDLICMGSRGMTGLKHVLLGSTATKVLHLADRPVLVVT
jgi:nucleotide-binding universal stress UspA family protein